MFTTTKETIAELIAKQVMATNQMLEILAKHGASAVVEVVRRETPFGVFVVHVSLADKSIDTVQRI